MNQLPIDLDELNLRLQEFVGTTTAAVCTAVLSDESSISKDNARILSSEVAEQIGMMVVEKYLSEYSVFVAQRHPNGSGRFPDCRMENAPIEFKSWLLDLNKKDNKPTYSGANLKLFAESIENGDDSYLRALYIVAELQEVPNGGYRVASLRAGRIWNFCAGGISGSGEGLYIRSSGSKHDPGVSPREFATKLEQNAKAKGVDISAKRVLELIQATGVADLDERYEWPNNRREIAVIEDSYKRNTFSLDEAVSILKEIGEDGSTMVQLDPLQKMDEPSINAVVSRLHSADPRIILERVISVSQRFPDQRGRHIAYEGDVADFVRKKMRKREALMVRFPKVDSSPNPA